MDRVRAAEHAQMEKRLRHYRKAIRRSLHFYGGYREQERPDGVLLAL